MHLVQRARDLAAAGAANKSLRWEAAGVFAVTLAAALVRLSGLDQAPPGLHGDEGWMGIEGLRILRDGPIGVWSPSALGQPAGPFYWTAAVFLFFDPGIVSVRLSTALLGVATVPAAYVFFRLLFGRQVAFFGTALLALGFWHIVFSRIAFPPIAMPLAQVLGFAALFYAFKRDTLAAYVMAGALLGLGFHSYIPYPFVALGVGLYLIGWAGWELRRGRRWQNVGLRLGALALGGMAVAGPFVAFVIQNPEPYQGYGQHTLILLSDADWPAKLSQMKDRLLTVPTVFFTGRNIDFTDALGAQPLLDPITRILFVAGLGVALWHWRDRRYLFLLTVLVFSLLPAVLSGSNWGENRRIIGAVPVMYLLAGIGLASIWRFGVNYAPQYRSMIPVAAAIVLLLVGALNLRTYFSDWNQAPETNWVFASEMAVACAFMPQREPASSVVYFYSARWSYRYETCRFLAPELPAVDRSREFGETVSLEKNTDGPVLYMFLPPYIDLVDQVEAQYPGGTRIEEKNGAGELLFTAYMVGG